MSRDGQQYGPYSIKDARAHLAAGNLLPTDSAFVEGMAEWTPLDQVLAANVQPSGSTEAQQSAEDQASSRMAALMAAREAKKRKKASGEEAPAPEAVEEEQEGLQKKKLTTADGVGFLYKNRAILAAVVIIATGLYLYNEYFRSPGPDQGEDLGAEEIDQEMNEMEEQNGGSGEGGMGGPGDPGG